MLDPDPLADVWEWEGIGPAGEASRLFRLPKSTIIRAMHESGNQAVFNDAFLVVDVTRTRASVHHVGLGRAGQDEALCYCGIPSYEFSEKHGKKGDVLLPTGFTFMVFLTRELVVTKWRPCEESHGEPGFAIDHNNRFGRQIWPPAI